MIDALHISQSGLKANQDWVQQISNNVANIQTVGYKKSLVQFENMVSLKSVNRSNTNLEQEQNVGQGIGTITSNLKTDFTAGPVKLTNRSSDIAVDGQGFIEVVLDNGEYAYTRHGSLSINQEGYLSSSQGYMLSDQIQVPPDIDELHIKPDGRIYVTYADTEGEIELGKIHLALISQTDQLVSSGNSLYKINLDNADVILKSPGEEGAGRLLQGYLEFANVDLVEEMTNLVLAQRAYQLNARLIQTSDQILETVNNLRR